MAERGIIPLSLQAGLVSAAVSYLSLLVAAADSVTKFSVNCTVSIERSKTVLKQKKIQDYDRVVNRMAAADRNGCGDRDYHT